MSDSAAVQELSWPLLERFYDRPLDKIPEKQRALAIASVIPFSWDNLAPSQRETLIKMSDCPRDTAASHEFCAVFNGFGELAKKAGITAAEAAEAILTDGHLGYSVDSLARMLNTVDELNVGRAVFYPLGEWLRRAKEKGIAYLPSLDWAVEQYLQRVVEAPEKHKQPTFRPQIGWQIELFDCWLSICQTHSRKPTPAEAIRWLKRNNKSGVILNEGAANELWWVPQRKAKATGNSPAQKGKMVTLHSVETVISSWSTKGMLPS